MSLNRAAIGLAITGGLIVAGSPYAAANHNASASASALGAAIAGSGSSSVVGAAITKPPQGTPSSVSTHEMWTFPNPFAGSQYAVLSTGDATRVTPWEFSFTSHGHDLGGGGTRGADSRDVTTLRLDLNPPAGTTCLSFEFQLISEERNEPVATPYADSFIAEINATTWSAENGVITAPGNIAKDLTGKPITVNSTGPLGIHWGGGASSFDGGTGLLRASAPFPTGDGNGTLPGKVSLYLSIFDFKDARYDSAVMVDDLRFATCSANKVNPVPDLDYEGDDSQSWGQGAYLQARLSDAITAAPLANRNLAFVISNDVQPVESTDAQGIAFHDLETVPRRDFMSSSTRFDGDFFYPRARTYGLYIERHPTSLYAQPLVAVNPAPDVTLPTITAWLFDELTGEPVEGALVHFTTRSPLSGVSAQIGDSIKDSVDGDRGERLGDWVAQAGEVVQPADETICIAETDVSGEASCAAADVADEILSLGFNAEFWGNADFEESYARGSLIQVMGIDPFEGL